MTFRRLLPMVALISGLPLAALGQHNHGGHATPYAGLETRAIKSLSDEDIAELRRGGGWGLALPAVLSGLPGPARRSALVMLACCNCLKNEKQSPKQN